MLKIFTLGLLAAASIATPALAGAATDSEARTAAVRYADLDLDTAAGQRMLQRRIEVAAREVCGMAERVTGSHTASASSRNCYGRALESIQREVAARTDYQPERG